MIHDLFKRRRSIRKYRNDPVSREDILKCVEAARLAPTACNTQSCRFFIAEGDLKNRIVDECLGDYPVPNGWAREAPVIAVVATVRNILTHTIGGGLRKIKYEELDAGIAGEHFVMQATELGLGTCWIGWFRKKRLKKLLNLPTGWNVQSLIVVGYSAETPPEIERIPLDDICKFGE
ncbi:MAG: nitroreductase family protein [Candidatus Krumholzibacteria bacterium]|nr:nitroreductase family protein [Candidatus Krumholzibacteria bacterium]